MFWTAVLLEETLMLLEPHKPILDSQWDLYQKYSIYNQ